MILLCLLLLGAPPIAPASVAPKSVSSAGPVASAPIDWANHAFTMFALRDGIAEMREYPMNGPHDYTRWQFKRAEAVEVGGLPHTVVLIDTLYSAPGVSNEALTAYLFKGGTQVGRPIEVPTRSARITIKGAALIGRWRVGKERFAKRWRITDKGLISSGKPAHLRPRALGH